MNDDHDFDRASRILGTGGMNTPMDPSDSTIHRMYGDKFKGVNGINFAMLPALSAALKADKIASMPANEKEEHPVANWLYRRSREGSFTLSKSDAHYIGNELDALISRVRELECITAKVDNVQRQIAASIESLSKVPPL